MFYTNYVKQNKKQTPGCFVMLSSSRDCKNLDSETHRKKKKFYCQATINNSLIINSNDYKVLVKSVF